MTPEMHAPTLEAVPEAAHSGRYFAELRTLPGDDKATVATNSWFAEKVDQFNKGMSTPSGELNIFKPMEALHKYIPALAASVLMHLVSAEAAKNEIGPATKFERNVLQRWAGNCLKEHKKQSVSHKALEFAEFMGLEHVLSSYMKKGLTAVKGKMGGALEASAIETLIATFASKEAIDILQNNVGEFETFVAINAAAVDSKGLLDVMKSTMEEAIHTHEDPTESSRR